MSFRSKLSSFEQRIVFTRTNATTATRVKDTHTLWNRSTIFWTLYCWTGLLEWYLVLVHDLPVVQICILNKILDNTNRLYNQLWRKIYLHNIPLMFAVAKDRSWQLHFYVTPYILHFKLLSRLYTWLLTPFDRSNFINRVSIMITLKFYTCHTSGNNSKNFLVHCKLPDPNITHF